MRKLLASIVLIMMVCGTVPVQADATVTFQDPKLITHNLSPQERTYAIRIPVIYQDRLYAGPNTYEAEAEGRWINGKATETIIVHSGDKNSPQVKIVKTADCPQDPWMTANPVYQNPQKSVLIFNQAAWNWIGPLATGNSFYSANLLQPTKAMLREELAKLPPDFLSPADGSQFQALHLVKLTIRKHPDYSLYLEYEYRTSDKTAFAPLYIPRIHNKVEKGDSFIEELSFIQPGEWRIRARANNLTGAQPSPWLHLTVKPKNPVIVAPVHNATYQLRPNIGGPAKMTAIVPVKIEHNANEVVHLTFSYSPDNVKWSDPSRSSFSFKSTRSEFVTEGTITIHQAGIYRMSLCSDLVEGCIGREFTVVNPLDKLLHLK